MANEYPTVAFSGPKPAKYIKHPKDYREITDFAEYVDKGVDTNESATDAPQRWTFIYRGLTQPQAKVIIDHYNTNRLSAKFTLAEPRNDFSWTPSTGTVGTTYTNLVQYEEPIQIPEHQNAWNISLTVKLIMRPS